MKGGSSGFPDNVTFPGGPEACVNVRSVSLRFFGQLRHPWFKMVTDSHRLNIRHTHEAQKDNGKGSLLWGGGWQSLHGSQLGSKNGAIGSVAVRRGTCSLIKTRPGALWWVSSGADTLCRPERWCWTFVFQVYTQEVLLLIQMLVFLMLACRRQVNNNEDTLKRTIFKTLITLWMLCTIVLNLRPALVMLDLIYINV